MDLSSLIASSDVVELQLKTMAGELMETEAGEAISLLVIGTDHSDFIKANNAIMNQRLKKATMTRKVQVTAEQLEAENLQRTAACIKGFKNITLDESLEYNDFNVRKLLKSVPFIREQVDEFVADRANFLK
jgi:hypothetical protein